MTKQIGKAPRSTIGTNKLRPAASPNFILQFLNFRLVVRKERNNPSGVAGGMAQAANLEPSIAIAAQPRRRRSKEKRRAVIEATFAQGVPVVSPGSTK